MAGEGDVLQNWSSRVEELVDEDNTEGAVKLLEDVIAKLEILNNANINLTLAAALNDVGRLYANQGLSIKADSFFTKALLIKQRAQQSGANLREEQKNGTLGGPNLEENEKSKEIPTGEASRCSDEDHCLKPLVPKQIHSTDELGVTWCLHVLRSGIKFEG
eukprot:Gb_20134 [translate_table: standard]